MPSAGSPLSHDKKKGEPSGLETLAIRVLTSLLIAFFGALFCGIAWLVFDATWADSKSPKSQFTAAGIIALVGFYVLYLGLRKMVRRPAPSDRSLSQGEQVRNFYIVSAFTFVGLYSVATPLTRGYLGPLLSIVVYSVALYVAFCSIILIHELGHYFAALIVGRKPVEFSVGDGRKLWEAKHGDLLVTWRLIPFVGHVAVNDDQRWSRLGIVFFAAAGPFVTLLLGIAIYAMGPQWVSSIVPDPWKTVWVNLRIVTLPAIGYSIIFSLIPARFQFGGRAIPSDGVLILSGLFPLRSWG